MKSPRSLVAALLVIAAVALASPAKGDEPTVTVLVGLDTSRPADVAAAARSVGGRVTDGIAELAVREVEVPASRAAALARRLADEGVAFVERETQVRASVVPNDPLWQYQWGATRIDAPPAWDVTTGSHSVVIAVIDTGVDASRDDLAGKVLPGWDFVNGDADASDDNGHGTSAAIVAAAGGNEAVGVAGLCWSCAVLPVKVLDAGGAGGTSNVARGITWAADNGATVLNLSFGGPTQSSAVDSAVAYARSKGAVVVGAAGNEGVSTPSWPAASAGVIGVAGSTESDGRYSWSNYGSWVDVAAPGCNPAYIAKLGRYDWFCGTSSATPVVAGVAALGLSLGASAVAVESALSATAVPVGTWVAAGRIEADAFVQALDAAATEPAPEPAPAPQPAPEPAPEPAPAPAPAPDPVSSEPVWARSVTRAAGENRVATAVEVARRATPDAASVVVARADDPADALAAAPLAATLGAPVLLTPSHGLAAAVASFVRDAGATRAVLVGGTTALGEAVVADLRDAGVADVERVAGVSRFDTARLVAERVGGTAVYVVEGSNPDPARGWPDAVAVSGLAALQRRPILLVTRDTLPPETAAALGALGATSATIVGGTAAVSTSVADRIAAQVSTVERVAGASRYDTSAQLAERATAAGATVATVWVATGRSWPDALAAGPAAAAEGSVLVLVDGTDLSYSPESRAWLGEQGRSWSEGVLVGGLSTISAGVEAEIRTLGT